MSRLRRSHAITLLALVAFSVALVAAMSAPVQEATAGSLCGVETDCESASRGLSSMTVRHEEILAAGNNKVQISGTDNWNIEVTYLSADDDNSPTCSCDEPEGHADWPFVVTASVVWNSTTGTWTATCLTGCDAANGPVYDVIACDLSSSKCSRGSGPATVYQSHAYKLMVEADLVVYDPCSGGTGNHFLDNVEYEATPSNGYVLTMADCLLGATIKTPIYTTYTNNDGGAFECKPSSGSCATVAGPEILLSYQ